MLGSRSFRVFKGANTPIHTRSTNYSWTIIFFAIFHADPLHTDSYVSYSVALLTNTEQAPYPITFNAYEKVSGIVSGYTSCDDGGKHGTNGSTPSRVAAVQRL